MTRTGGRNIDSGVPGAISGGEVPVAMSLGGARRSALDKVDSASFSWFHVKVCIVAGIGFFTDAYCTFTINIASPMLGYVYGHGMDVYENPALKPAQELALKVATPVGTLLGQLVFGFLADRLGRKKMYGVELIIIIVGTFAQALAGSAPSVHIIGTIITWRIIAGIGVGADYPLSAIITSEFASTKIRGRMVVATFSSQGWGQFTASLVGLICVAAYHNPIVASHNTETTSVDAIWRLVIGLGCVPAAIALYFRLTIPETPRYTIDVERNIKQASEDIRAVMAGERGYVDPDVTIHRANAPRASLEDFCSYFGRWANLKVLLGTCWSWFALDIAFYGLALNPSTVENNSSFWNFWKPVTTDSQGIYNNLIDICIVNLVLSVSGLIPGYYATFLLIDKIGRKPIQLGGFVMLTILFLIMGFAYTKLIATPPAFLFLYCLTSFFQNFGPNSTTFIIPSEVFPTRYRATAHGISAASGKLGAIIAQASFTRLKNRGGQDMWINHVFEIYALFMLTGVLSTLLIPETNQKSLEELSNESQEDFYSERDDQVL